MDASQTQITSVGTLGSLAVTSSSTLGVPTVKIDAQDADKDALYIDATDLTTGHGLYIESDPAKSNEALFVEQSFSGSADGAQSVGIKNYWKKISSLASQQNLSAVGILSEMDDNAGNSANSAALLTAFKGVVDSTNSTGNNWNTGLELVVTDGSLNTGILLNVENSGDDIKMVSNADTNDYCTIATTTSGATTITTVDAGATAAHFEIAADGNITLDAAGDIALVATGNDITVDTDTLTIESTTASNPQLLIKNTTNDNSGAEMRFIKDKGAAAANSDEIGIIKFYGDNNAQEQQYYAHIKGQIANVGASDGSEGGAVKIAVASHDGELLNGLVIQDGNAEDEVDVTLGSGDASLTTVAGTLTMGSTAFASNTGVIAVATQGTIDHDSLANFVTAEHVDWAGASAGTIHSSNIPTLNQNTTGTAAGLSGSLSSLVVLGGVVVCATDGEDKLYINRYSSTYPYAHIQAGFADENVKVGIKLDTRKADGVAENALVIEGDTRAATFTGALTVDGALNGTLATAVQTNITSLGTLSSLAVTSDAGLGSAAMTLTNADVDQIALDINASNTTANVVDINASAVTSANAIKITRGNSTGSGSLGSGNSSTIYIDQNQDSTASSSNEVNNIINVDYDTAANVTGVNFTRGVYVDINDTSNTSSNAGVWRQKHGFHAKISKDNTHSNNFHAGFFADVSGAGPYQYSGNPEFYNASIYKAGNVGFFSKGESFAFVSTAGDDEDYFGIKTTTNGATKLVTSDVTGAAAHFEIEADGNITLDAAGDIALESGGGSITSDASLIHVTSASSEAPVLLLENTNTASASSPIIALRKNGADTEDGEQLGAIYFQGEDEGNNNTSFASIVGNIAESDESAEEGKLTLNVASHDAELQPGLIIASGNVEDEVDVTIANGTASSTTVAGKLAVLGSRINTTSMVASGKVYANTFELNALDDTTIARASAGVVTIEGNQIVTGGAVNVASGAQAPVAMMVARRTITQAEMNALHTTPIEIIPAPGANKVIVIVVGGSFAHVDRAATNSVVSTLGIGFDGFIEAHSVLYARRFVLGLTTDSVHNLNGYQSQKATVLTNAVNKKIEAKFFGACTNNSFTSLDLIVNYYILDLS